MSASYVSGLATANVYCKTVQAGDWHQNKQGNLFKRHNSTIYCSLRYTLQYPSSFIITDGVCGSVGQTNSVGHDYFWLL